MKLNFCPECASPLVRQTDTKYVCANNHPYYNNPRGACSLVLINDNNELLFAKRKFEPKKGKYDLPGGFLDYNDDAYQAAIREAAEEMGIHINPEDLELIETSSSEYLENIVTCDFVFICHQWRGNIRPADDVTALEWKPAEFLKSADFAWPYPYLYNTLQKHLKTVRHV